jgi:hypothetical protein
MDGSKMLRIVNKSGDDLMVNIQIEKSYVTKLHEKIEAEVKGGFKGFEASVSVAKGQLSRHSVDKGSDVCYVTVLRKGKNYGHIAVTALKGTYASLIVNKDSFLEDKDYDINLLCKAGSEISVDDHILKSVKVEVGGIIYGYRVVVSVAEGNWDLRITDEEGDVYSLWCLKPGLHYVDYNSKKPNIVKVKRIFCP